ncbi:MAG: endonuclease domain-containing protein [Bacteroidales bacterium]|nr:endonuclease domain-containing protein [Bacteroidales bacterium]
MEINTVETNLPAKLLEHARNLRKDLTDAEELLWQLIRNRQLSNWKFRRQHPLAEGFILDFYCAETRVAVELDGQYHKDKMQREVDEDRTSELGRYGIKVIRFWNTEVLNNTESVLRRIVEFSSPPAPLQVGEGERRPGENVNSPLSRLERGRG